MTEGGDHGYDPYETAATRMAGARRARNLGLPVPEDVPPGRRQLPPLRWVLAGLAVLVLVALLRGSGTKPLLRADCGRVQLKLSSSRIARYATLRWSATAAPGTRVLLRVGGAETSPLDGLPVAVHSCLLTRTVVVRVPPGHYAVRLVDGTGAVRASRPLVVTR